MNPQMNLLYLKSTGHVLAGFIRNGEPVKGEAVADAFVGDGLHLRGFGDPAKYSDYQDFNTQDPIIPSTEIAIFRTVLDSSIIRSPFKSILSNLDSTPTLGAPKGPPATPPFGSLPAAGITITLPQSVPGSTKALLTLETSSPTLPTVIAFVIDPPSVPAAKQDVTLPLPTLGTGKYYALVFVPGYQSCVVTFSVP
jgi:hypothetical protein